ncbi:hypothetical protein SAMN05660461_5090 [Chitinophaga ginsengisegetis]|uniref:Uncharacterized protein n=1 Tax=Chitinophaga ginsengisegetis TaxID=393003 RepID=A0A1T5P9B0_9BACT|nr:hypothetical protein [Chitinophaga ginsengisegetis]SKD09207.1 hypothetical protein SAMN05660461_5090 [Chitinophaga ginsengisegetis]
MEPVIANAWCWLCFSAALLLLTAFIMLRQARHFYLLDVVVRKFSIIDLQFPASSKEIPELIKGIYALPAPQRSRTLSALRGQLWVDFLFMPALYGSIFLLCIQVADKMTPAGEIFFECLAWLQLIAWLFDAMENGYLLNKIKPDVTPSTPEVHKAYQQMVFAKWILLLTGIVCALSALLFFWVSGKYETRSLHYLLILVGEGIVFVIAEVIAGRRKVPEDAAPVV